MKKLISIIALFTVVSLNAYCEEIPAAIQTLIKVMEESCLEMQDDKVSCGGVFAEGHDVVLCMLMDERHYDGMPLTEAVDVTAGPAIYNNPRRFPTLNRRALLINKYTPCALEDLGNLG